MAQPNPLFDHNYDPHFHPTHEEVLRDHLLPAIEGESPHQPPLDSRIIIRLDVYDQHPMELMMSVKLFIKGRGYFYTQRKRKHDGGPISRKNGRGTWKQNGSKEEVRSNNVIIGYRRKFTFRLTAKRGKKWGSPTEWVMTEYADIAEGEFVICKIKLKGFNAKRFQKELISQAKEEELNPDGTVAKLNDEGSVIDVSSQSFNPTEEYIIPHISRERSGEPNQPAERDGQDDTVKIFEKFDAGAAATECIHTHSIGAPQEFVKKALHKAMEEENERVLDLLEECFNGGRITMDEMGQGFGMIKEQLNDLALPNSKLNAYVKHAQQKGWIPSKFLFGEF